MRAAMSRIGRLLSIVRMEDRLRTAENPWTRLPRVTVQTSKATYPTERRSGTTLAVAWRRESHRFLGTVWHNLRQGWRLAEPWARDPVGGGALGGRLDDRGAVRSCREA